VSRECVTGGSGKPFRVSAESSPWGCSEALCRLHTDLVSQPRGGLSAQVSVSTGRAFWLLLQYARGRARCRPGTGEQWKCVACFCFPPPVHRTCLHVRRWWAWQPAGQPHVENGQNNSQGVSELILLSPSRSFRA